MTERVEDGGPAAAGDAGRRRSPMLCPSCGSAMRFEDGASTHDLYAERFVCPGCGRTEYRSYGRGSV